MRTGALISALCIALAACLPTALKPTTSFTGTPVTASYKTGASKPLVVLRYISSVDPASKPAATRLYNQKHPFGQAEGHPINPSAFDETILKTNFYTLEFYDHLRRHLQGADVILQPLTLKEAGGRLVAEPRYTAPPAALTVDFHAYMHPMWNIGWWGLWGGATRGNKLEPFITLRTAPDLNSEIKGAVAGMGGFIKFMEPDAVAAVDTNGYGATIVELLNTTVLPENMPPSSLVTKENTIKDLPLQKGKFLALDEQIVTLKEDATNGYSAESAFNGYTNIIQSALNFIVPQGKSSIALATYATMFDPALAEKIRGGGPLSDMERKKRLLIVRKLVPNEVKFIRSLNEKLLTKTLLGEWGDSFRDYRDAEEKADQESASVQAGALFQGMLGMIGSSMGGANTNMLTVANQMEKSLQAIDQKFEEYSPATAPLRRSSSSKPKRAGSKFRQAPCLSFAPRWSISIERYSNCPPLRDERFRKASFRAWQ